MTQTVVYGNPTEFDWKSGLASECPGSQPEVGSRLGQVAQIAGVQSGYTVLVHCIGNVKEVSLSLVLAGQRYTVEPLARAEVKQEPPWAQMGRGTLWNPSQELR